MTKPNFTSVISKLRKVRRWLLFAFLAFNSLCSIGSVANEIAYDEGTVRAAVIFNILRFTEWKDHQGDHLNLCRMGQGNSLEHLQNLNGKRIKNFTLQILSPKNAEEFNNCQVVVLGNSKLNLMKGFHTNANHFVFCDGCSNAAQTANIELVLINNNVKFNVNLEAESQNKVVLSSDLLLLANEVRGKIE